MSDFATQWTAARQASLSSTVSPGVCSNSCPLNQWCRPTVSAAINPFSYPQSSQHQGLFQWVSSSHQVAKVLEISASVLPMNIHDWLPLGLTDLISLLSKGLSKVFFSTTIWKHQFLSTQPSLWSHSHIIHGYWKNLRFVYMDLCQQTDVSTF